MSANKPTNHSIEPPKKKTKKSKSAPQLSKQKQTMTKTSPHRWRQIVGSCMGIGNRQSYCWCGTEGDHFLGGCPWEILQVTREISISWNLISAIVEPTQGLILTSHSTTCERIQPILLTAYHVKTAALLLSLLIEQWINIRRIKENHFKFHFVFLSFIRSQRLIIW
jgi:hypothetical protein